MTDTAVAGKIQPRLKLKYRNGGFLSGLTM